MYLWKIKLNAIVDQPSPAQSATTDVSPIQWTDRKYYLWLLSPAIPMIGAGALIAYQMSPKKLRMLSWIGPILVHAIIPVLDKLVGEDGSNPPEEVIAQLEQNPYYARLVKSFIPFQLLANVFTMYVATRDKTPVLDKFALTVSVGVLNGIAFNTAHELSHKHTPLERFLSMLTIAPTFYTHFSVEHPLGHHKRAATPEDPASSKMGESFWRYLPRTVIGGVKSAIEIETRRMKRRGKSFWSADNELLQGWAMSGAYWGATLAIFGRKSLPIMVGQAAYAIGLFEVINYIEHYGLMRQKDDMGKYERTRPEHSWNSNRVVTNLVLYQLQRHSDHHAYPSRSFQALRHFDNTPQLPSGYASMLLPAYIPAWWYELMDKRVADHYQGDLTKANILPAKRAQLMQQFGKAEQKIDIMTEVATVQ